MTKPVPPHKTLPARLEASRVPDVYRWIAPIHDLGALILESKARQVAISMSQVTDGSTIADIGTGTGLTLLELIKRNPGGQIIAIDRTPEMLRKAERRARRSGHPDCQVLRGDARSLSLEDGSLDLLISTYMVDLLPESSFPDLLTGFRRTIRPGGRMTLAYMGPPRNSLQGIWDKLYSVRAEILGGCRCVSLVEAAEEAGFEDIQVRFVSQWTFPTEILTARRPG